MLLTVPLLLGLTPVTPEQGSSVAREIGAKYMECSAKSGEGVQAVFDAALREGCKSRWGLGGSSTKGRSRKCVIL